MKRVVLMFMGAIGSLAASPLIAWAQEASEDAASEMINTDVFGTTGGLVNVSHVMVLQMASFLIFVYLMGRFAFNPIREFMRRRSEKVAEEIRLAEDRHKTAERSMAEAVEEMERAKREAYEIIQRSRDDARRAREEIIEEAKEAGKKVVESARGEIDRERAKAVEEIRSQVGDLAVAVAARVLERQVSPDDDKRLVEEALKDSGRLM